MSEQYNTTEYVFRPVQGLDKNIKSKEPIEGYVYFATDTKKIYLGQDDNFLPMGGNSGVYYGDRIITDEEDSSGITVFTFTFDDIEGDVIPSVDDLILNIPDGCFYRVVEVNTIGSTTITAERLTIAGGGGGGSGSSKPVINDVDKGATKYFVADQEKMEFSFYCTSQQPVANRIETVQYYLGTNLIYTDTKTYDFGENITFDISPYLNLVSTSTQNTLGVKVTDVYGNESNRKSFYFYVIELKLESDFDEIYLLENNILSYPCKPLGGAGLTNRYIYITLSPVNNESSIIVESTTKVESTNINRTIPIDLTDKVTHGVYILKAYFKALLDSGEQISSPEITSQIVYYDEDVNTPLIAAHLPTRSLSQYDTLNITYLIADRQASESEYVVELSANDEISNEIAKLNDINIWSKLFIQTGIYTLTIKYKNQNQVLPTVAVTVYEGDMPTIDTTNIEMYLSAQGRNNNEANKESWEYNGYEGSFEKFLWGNANGWLLDKDGSTALKLTNGAKFSLPTYHPFGKNATIDGLTIELDFMFSGVLDYSKPLIQCLSTYLDTVTNVTMIETGFHITGQKATLNSSINKATTTALGGEEDADGNINETDMALQAFTQFFNEDERIHLSYVIQRIPSNATENNYYFVYTYLNGVLSGIMKMSLNETFKDNANDPSFIKFDSTYGDIYIYNIRVYRTALDTRTIINNYIADLTDIDKKIALYKDNNIFDDAGFISLNAIQDISYQLGVPYVLFKGGCQMDKQKTKPISYSDAPEFKLPLTKSDYRLMSVQMFDRTVDNEKPIINIPLNLKNNTTGEIITDFKNIQTNTEYTPIRGVQTYGQGTSSMVYPVKNLRLKFIQETDYPTVYNGSFPVEIVCFKADFMDSSSSHNTATANLIYDLYANMGLKTPAQSFRSDNLGKEGVAEYDLVTAIKGFPIICFYAEGNSDNYTYIGRYNFNLDKATPEPFGFPPQWFYTGETVVDSQGRTRKVVKSIGLKVENIEGKTVLPLDNEGKEIKRDIVQCWEILNNDNGSPCKFLTLDNFRTFKESLTTNHNWTEYYEDRYPDAMASGAKWELGDSDEKEYPNLAEDLENGIFRLACWINSTATQEVTNAALSNPVYYKTLDTIYNPNKIYYDKVNDNYIIKDIVSFDGAKVEAGIPLNEKEYPNNLKPILISVENFGNKVNNIYNQYTFVYIDDGINTKGWYLEDNYIDEDLADYSISYTGDPIHTNTLIVNYYETNNWSSTLYEEYLIDNAAYRLSKFKAEFEQYFNLDFVLFYYTLTMILLMMDSRAKNMMLASWDQTIWYPIFYDMDTMLGVNNTGFNKFSYDTEDAPSDKVFNGWDSVLWNNFRECFYPEICQFYAEMRSSGLTLEKLLTTYNAGSADKWNEALSTADAEYKYVRPYQEGYYDGKEGIFIKPGQVSYLYAGQGKRSNHRSWWLNNRIKYLDSKYMPLSYGSQKPSQANTFSFRAYALPEQKSTIAAEACIAQTPANHTFEITALNNSYQSLFIGNIVYGPKYTQAGQKVVLGPSQVKHEVESYILNPDLISNLGDLSDKYMGQLNFPGVTTRLTELNLGRSSRSHPEAYDKYYNNLLSALNIGESCPYLVNLNIARCTGLKDISLTKCTRLKKLDAEGSKLTNITFPISSVLEELYLPNTLTSLTLINQPYLTSIVFDDLAIGTSSIQKITLDKISNFNTYPIIKGIFNTSTIKNYYLTNVNWVIEDQELTDDGYIETIDILDKLMDDSIGVPNEGYNRQQALTGTLILNVPNSKVIEFNIYNKYNKTFPNLTILYGENVTITKAKHIQFMDNDIKEEANLYYEVFTDGSEKLGYLISKEGPNGIALGSPAKSSTDEYNYIFSGRWLCNDVIYTTLAEDTEYSSLYELQPNEDMIFYPVYDSTQRKYSIKFYDHNGIAVHNFELTWHSTYSVSNYLYRDSSDLDTYERWAFQGWSYTNYGDTNPIAPNYIDTSYLTVTGNLTAYAHFIKEDVRKVATKQEYFSFTDCEVNGVSGYSISLNDNYKTIIAGKVTLPSNYNSKPILKIADSGFKNNFDITHIFFLEAEIPQYKRIEGSAFMVDRTDRNPSLVGVYLPETIEYIGPRAFSEQTALETVHLSDSIKEIQEYAFEMRNGSTKLIVNELPASLEILGAYAFFSLATDTTAYDTVTVTKLPKNLRLIGDWALANQVNVCITDFTTEKLDTGLTIGSRAFYKSGANISDNSIFIRNSVISIGNEAFVNYGGTKLEYVYFERPEKDYEGSNLGFAENITKIFNYTES